MSVYKRCSDCGMVMRVEEEQATCGMRRGPYAPAGLAGTRCTGALTVTVRRASHEDITAHQRRKEPS